MAYIDLSIPPITPGTGPTLTQASGMRVSMGIPTFVVLAPTGYAALVAAGATDSNTIYIVQE